MPLINGQKMACEPCIRGHRSTKCTHADERLMVPVRKPGRPLSACPHPTSRPCSCAAVTAAIPKKQKCGCGTSKVSNDSPAQTSEATGSATLHPTSNKPSTPPFRVKKQISKNGASRKQSLDITSFGKMDATQLNILSSFGERQLEGVNGSNGTTSHFASSQSSLTPQIQKSTTANLAWSNGLLASQSPSSKLDTRPSAVSCCGDKSGNETEIMSTPTSTTQDSLRQGNHEGQAVGCCSSPAIQKSDPNFSPHMSPAMQSNGMMDIAMMTPFPTIQRNPNESFPYLPNSNLVAYPPQFGSYLQPLQLEQWRHMMSNFALGHTVDIPNPADQSTPTGVQSARPANASTWMSHHCSCGDSCQCVGCAAHPYNDATRDYVRSAINTMTHESRISTELGVTVNGKDGDLSGNYSSGFSPPRTQSDGNNQTDGTIQSAAPAAPRTPSETASGVSDEQSLSASDFFFVSYPFDDTCAGETASCPCGDDCQCIGCAIHSTSGSA